MDNRNKGSLKKNFHHLLGTIFMLCYFLSIPLALSQEFIPKPSNLNILHGTVFAADSDIATPLYVGTDIIDLKTLRVTRNGKTRTLRKGDFEHKACGHNTYCSKIFALHGCSGANTFVVEAFGEHGEYAKTTKTISCDQGPPRISDQTVSMTNGLIVVNFLATDDTKIEGVLVRELLSPPFVSGYSQTVDAEIDKIETIFGHAPGYRYEIRIPTEKLSVNISNVVIQLFDQVHHSTFLSLDGGDAVNKINSHNRLSREHRRATTKAKTGGKSAMGGPTCAAPTIDYLFVFSLVDGPKVLNDPYALMTDFVDNKSLEKAVDIFHEASTDSSNNFCPIKITQQPIANVEYIPIDKQRHLPYKPYSDIFTIVEVDGTFELKLTMHDPDKTLDSLKKLIKDRAQIHGWNQTKGNFSVLLIDRMAFATDEGTIQFAGLSVIDDKCHGWNCGYLALSMGGIKKMALDVEEILAHEMGHLFGLGHSTNPEHLMFPLSDIVTSNSLPLNMAGTMVINMWGDLATPGITPMIHNPGEIPIPTNINKNESWQCGNNLIDFVSQPNIFEVKGAPEYCEMGMVNYTGDNLCPDFSEKPIPIISDKFCVKCQCYDYKLEPSSARPNHGGRITNSRKAPEGPTTPVNNCGNGTVDPWEMCDPGSTDLSSCPKQPPGASVDIALACSDTCQCIYHVKQEEVETRAVKKKVFFLDH